MKAERMTLQGLLAAGREILEQAGVREPELDARYLLLEAFQTDPAHFLMDRSSRLPDDGETDEMAACYREMIHKRAERVPLQHILGTQEFMGITFYVDRHVLVPRQDTETLVELVLKEHPGDGEQVLDLCTGSGCIAVSLAALGGYGKIVGVDLSPEALDVAAKNRAHILGQGHAWREGCPVELLEGDLFSAFMPGQEKFHILTANPPYIPTKVIEGLEPEVKDHEPRMALDGSGDGLAFYRRIAKDSGAYLEKDASVYLEIGYDQGDAVREIFRQAGFADLRIVKDAAGNDRVAAARWPGEEQSVCEKGGTHV